MRKNKLVANFDFDFSLLAIVSQLKEYKLAWTINRELGIKLVKQQDQIFEFLGNVKLCISNYKYYTQHSSIRLLYNRSRNESASTIQYLIPELRQFDYLMMIEGFEDSLDVIEVRNTMRHLEGIQLVNHVGVDQLKSRENLIF